MFLKLMYKIAVYINVVLFANKTTLIYHDIYGNFVHKFQKHLMLRM